MKIDKKLLNKLCRLARLKITPEEETSLQKNLSEILSHFQKINTLDTGKVPPLFNPLQNSTPLREDIPKDFQDTDACLNQTTHRKGRLFKSPPAV